MGQVGCRQGSAEVSVYVKGSAFEATFESVTGRAGGVVARRVF